MAHPFHVEPSGSETLLCCPICGCAESHPYLTAKDHSVSHEVFSLRTCDSCGFCATSPRPSPSGIGRYYESDTYISHTNSSSGLVEQVYQLVRRLAIRNKHRLIARHQSARRVLDVGCGTGDFLAYLRDRGYQAHGVEPNQRAREQAILNHSLPVAVSLGEIGASASFDAITLWHVLEHMHNPAETLETLRELSVTGGLLVIAVPDMESWDSHHYGADWAALDVPRHLSHFRRRDVNRLLESRGFRVLANRRMWFDAPYVCMLSERYRGSGAIGSFIKGASLGVFSNIVSAANTRPTSSTLYLARKA